MTNNISPFPESKKKILYETIAAISLLLYFSVKLGYFATRIGENVAPDEFTWYGISRLFAGSWLVPPDSPDSYQYGVVARAPYFYFWVMGKALAANVFGVSDLIFLRFVNAAIGLTTVCAGYLLVRRLSVSIFIRLTFLALITNTLMFTFLSAAVNYDNLTNCLAVLALYQGVIFMQEREVTRLLVSLLCILLGCLTKFAFLPYAVFILVVLFYHERKKLLLLPRGLKGVFSPPRAAHLVLVFLSLLAFACNLELYGGNYVKYGRIDPDLERVAGLNAAMQYRIFARNYIVQQFKEGKITYAEAVRMTSLIKFEGDRAGALYLLEQAAVDKPIKNSYRLTRLEYLWPWLQLVSAKTFGIMGHQNMEKAGRELFPYYGILAVALAWFIFTFRPSDLNALALYLIFLTMAYTLVIILLVNYPTYIYSGVIVLALQGRYLFPVLVPAYILVATYAVGKWPRTWQQGIAASTVAAIFIVNEFPWFLANARPEWFFAR